MVWSHIDTQKKNFIVIGYNLKVVKLRDAKLKIRFEASEGSKKTVSMRWVGRVFI